MWRHDIILSLYVCVVVSLCHCIISNQCIIVVPGCQQHEDHLTVFVLVLSQVDSISVSLLRQLPASLRVLHLKGFSEHRCDKYITILVT